MTPQPAKESITEVGEAFTLYLGEPTSFKKNDVEIKVDTVGADFIRFDNDKNEL